ncbi:hypothetical protein [Aliiruegeria sabulilitoris]|uniref:hypothetical protein n=1 Tax=Aliiruegeria sabulilitoris TaxID=1510458 RepID=UPI00082C7C38|nr:hypothetical protein [Aliiruegeria sabulilitoris]NDR56618.1 hypothetical protein [Pseudoruegeria sp. M32A2M]
MNQDKRRIETPSDVIAAMYWGHCAEIELATAKLKYRGLLQHALKYALWALAPGGVLTILDNGPNDGFVAPFTVPFSIVRMLAFQMLGAETETLDLDPKRQVIQLKRISEPVGNTWQAGIIISGAPQEKQPLQSALEGLLAQPELTRPSSVLVCGPKSAKGLLPADIDTSKLEYIPYEGTAAKPFPICKKKNHLISAMTADKIIVSHARIKFDANVLRNSPNEFDFAAPMIFVESGHYRKRHISYTIQDARLPARYGTRVNLGSRYADDPRIHLSARQPFIDGAVFLAARESYLRNPLNANLGWGDAEDVEWCTRAQANGFLVDFWPKVTGITTVDKLNTRTELPSKVFELAQFTKRNLVRISRSTRHVIELAAGRR